MNDIQKNIFNEKEASKILGMEVSTLRKRRFDGRGPIYLKIGKSVVYRLEDLTEFMNASRVLPKPDDTDDKILDLMSEVRKHYEDLIPCEEAIEYQAFALRLENLDNVLRHRLDKKSL